MSAMLSYKKYELINPIEFEGRTLYRLRALRNIRDVRAGRLGGYVEGAHNLSHNGNCWIHYGAKVYEQASVCNAAIVKGNVIVRGNANIMNKAVACGNAIVQGNAVIQDMSVVSSACVIRDNAIISGKSVISGSAIAMRDAVINNCHVSGTAIIIGSIHRNSNSFLWINGGVISSYRDINQEENDTGFFSRCKMSSHDIFEYQRRFLLDFPSIE